MTEKKIPTVDEVLAGVAKVRDILSQLTVHAEYVIDDYPIGGTNRGKCKLTVDEKKRTFRMTRQTIDKFGRWCKPKSSVYHPLTMICVVSGPAVEKEAAWLQICTRGVYLVPANWGEPMVLFEMPFWSKPRRQPTGYTMNGVPQTIEADPPEHCDAWDVWEPAMIEMMNTTLAKWRAAVEELATAK